MAFDLVRPFGVITSVGIHPGQPLPLTGRNLYDKNVSLDFGRCPARAMLPMAFDLLGEFRPTASLLVDADWSTCQLSDKMCSEAWAEKRIWWIGLLEWGKLRRCIGRLTRARLGKCCSILGFEKER